jgi:hypothetical protein
MATEGPGVVGLSEHNLAAARKRAVWRLHRPGDWPLSRLTGKKWRIRFRHWPTFILRFIPYSNRSRDKSYFFCCCRPGFIYYGDIAIDKNRAGLVK